VRVGRALRLLVLDAYPREGRDALRAAGATEAGVLYAQMLERTAPGAQVDVAWPADADFALPRGAALADYDGVAWTGSSLTIHADGDDRVRRQVELARAAFAAGVPAFGSCWAAQVAVVAAGGACASNPRGREFGVSRKIALSDAGRAHPLFEGKAAVFDALTSHADEVVTLPPGARLLASNRFTRVQAVAVTHGAGAFWAVQYHPEYDLREVARLAVLRADELLGLGCFRDRAALDAWVSDAEALQRDAGRADLAWRLGVDDDVLDPAARQREVRNWIERLVLPRAARR
jgi:GMP synthase (glutamine-hydrolysing)